MKKILVIGYVWPEPKSSAAGSHIMSIMRLFLAQNWKVEFATPCAISEHMIDLETEGISSKSIELNSDSFDEYVSSYNPNIVMFDRFMMEEQFGWRVEKNCPNALKILDTEDLQSLRNARHKALKEDRKMNKSDLFSDLAKREIAAILRCDISLIISSYEMQLLIDTFKIDKISYMYTSEKILVRVPSSLIKNPIDLNEKLDDLFLSKHKININLYKSILSRKNIYILITLIFILICVNVFKLISYKKENTYLTNNTFKIKEVNYLPSSMIKTTSIISEYEKRILIENRKRELISYLISNRKFKVKSLELNNGSILVSYYSIEKKDLEKYISKVYKVLSSQVRDKKLYVRVEI